MNELSKVGIDYKQIMDKECNKKKKIKNSDIN